MKLDLSIDEKSTLQVLVQNEIENTIKSLENYKKYTKEEMEEILTENCPFTMNDNKKFHESNLKLLRSILEKMKHLYK